MFITLLIVALIPVWANKFFLTGDGPCHVYNSKVLVDWLMSRNINFYEHYYIINKNLEPNWITHASLMLLVSWLPGNVAEKIFVSCYVILYASATRQLIKSIQPNNRFLALLVFPFIYSHTFQMGFYNYSISIALFFVCVAYWYLHRNDFDAWRILIFSLLNLLLYFSHPIGLLLTVITIITLIVFSFCLNLSKDHKEYKKHFNDTVNLTATSTVAFLPAFVLLVANILKRGEQGMTPPDATVKQLYHHFLELQSLITLSDFEAPWLITLSITLGVLGLYAIVLKVMTRNFQMTDAFFLVFLITLYLYFNPLQTMASVGVMEWRTQFIPYLIILCWISSFTFPNIVKHFVRGISVLIFLALIVVRLPYHASASKAVEEYISVGDHIQNHSTVLTLSYSHSGLTPERKQISDKIWLFIHAFDYAGTAKSLILLTNYEATTGYFPLHWVGDKNPFYFLGINGGSLVELPPYINIEGYYNIGCSVDYVVTWCFDQSFFENANTKDVFNQLHLNYDLITTSKNGLVNLYKRKHSSNL